LKTGYQLDLTASNFYELVGFDRVILKDTEKYGSRMPNLSQDTDMLNIQCDLVNTSLVDGVDTYNIQSQYICLDTVIQLHYGSMECHI